ncbi:hypothetical protein ACROYT_G029960 [Oculina patagonica]
MKLGLQKLSNFLLIMTIVASFFHSAKGRSEGSFEGASFINFKKDEFSYLNITSIGSDLITDSIECGFACLEIPTCFSYNLAAFADISEKLLCELLQSDKYNNSDKFVVSPLFHHYSIPSPCSSWPCKNNGSCISQYEKKSYACHCVKGFTGKHCQTDINECESSPCVNNGTCTDLINGFNCSCPPGFSGNRCEKDINECESSPCVNNGTCTDLINGFNCSCPPGFSGDRCEKDVDECVEDLHACDDSSYCTNNVGSYTCKSHRGLGTSIILGSPLEHDKYLETLILYLDPVLTNSSKFVKCYHGKTDGWDTTTFHSKCDGKGPTVTIIKAEDYVFGGYTDVSWHSSCSYSSAAKAFIFSLYNINGYDPVKLSQYQYPDRAMFSCSSYGPVFGSDLVGHHDIYIPDNAANNQDAFTYCGSTYSLPRDIQLVYVHFLLEAIISHRQILKCFTKRRLKTEII